MMLLPYDYCVALLCLVILLPYYCPVHYPAVCCCLLLCHQSVSVCMRVTYFKLVSCYALLSYPKLSLCYVLPLVDIVVATVGIL